MLFQQKATLREELDNKNSFLKENAELVTKFKEVCSQLKPFNQFEELPLVNPLCFAADLTHPETKELHKRYEEDRRKITELMRQPNFINHALEVLN